MLSFANNSFTGKQLANDMAFIIDVDSLSVVLSVRMYDCKQTRDSEHFNEQTNSLDWGSTRQPGRSTP